MAGNSRHPGAGNRGKGNTAGSGGRTTSEGSRRASGAALRANEAEAGGRGRMAGADRTVPRRRSGSMSVEAAVTTPPMECPKRNRSGVRAPASASRRIAKWSRISAPASTRPRGPPEVPWPVWS